VSEALPKTISKTINECRQIKQSEKVILCLEELLKATNNGMVAYELGHEYKKASKNKEAIQYYEKAESLFTQTNYKNMARAAINNLKIEALIDKKKKE